jgi:hypothetical protein
LIVEINVIRTSVHVGEMVPVKVTNRSATPIFVWFSCPPALERLSGETWQRYESPMLCTADAPPPMRVEPGNWIDASIATAYRNDVYLQPGTYRRIFTIDGPNRQASTYSSREFTVEPAP